MLQLVFKSIERKENGAISARKLGMEHGMSKLLAMPANISCRCSTGFFEMIRTLGNYPKSAVLPESSNQKRPTPLLYLLKCGEECADRYQRSAQ